ncbi:FAD-dependent oxidoreductase [Arthrobacter sp. zg-Y820]|uniref:NAD(P)/FAD-dependent oxidoreductase n=1 Tax=unclassified Arthrobacter TaxID=235627 RepID=UPI001E4C0B17|nr:MULTISPECIES: FAD-dependent oxidoreductase [unclassified Arthrobacter]MCC9198082.1 FAD-binding oxidoreductase [Arthrobacter sp. zg-Y820]MDK1280949.1 FAD-dependent oxidoreductase [Arthrobacter sp. zg.Y820]WIB10423.1 FAD-dependent oxidoreductase [Arthrobacter sp. zg-Y820]
MGKVDGSEKGDGTREADGVGEVDILVVGGGIAGLSLGSALAGRTSVLVVEAEETLGFHTSSRSARQLIPSYGPAVIQDLTIRTLALIRALEVHLPEPVLTPRSFLLVGTEGTVRDRASGHMRPVTPGEVQALAPELKPGAFAAAGLDTTSVACNTDALMEYHRQRILDRGGRILTGHPVRSAVFEPGADDAGSWVTTAGPLSIRSRVVVNAAGAWADRLASLYGVRTRGLQPYRRTAAVVVVENPLAPGAPMVADADESFYYRAEGEQVLISPSETVPSDPVDARPRAEEVEALVKLVNSVTTLGITDVVRSWTGLRTEAADGLPVVGYDDVVPGFFWLAGQGGYGFQTSSGIAELAVAPLLGESSKTPAAKALDPARATL